MGPGQRLSEVAVALIGDDHRRAGLGNKKVRAGDADIGGEKLFAQYTAGFCQQTGRLREIAIAGEMRVKAAEYDLDLHIGEMYRRREVVSRHIQSMLDDHLYGND